MQSEVDCDIIRNGQTALDRATSCEIKYWDGVVDAAKVKSSRFLSVWIALVFIDLRVGVQLWFPMPQDAMSLSGYAAV